ncbi:MAG TPA: alpha-2-macroglobulin family protein [Longimicrobium sp.]
MPLPPLPTLRAVPIPALLLPTFLAASLAGPVPRAAAQERINIPALQPYYAPVTASGPVRVDTAGLRLRLSEGRESGGRPVALARWTALEPLAVQRLLGRLPPLGAEQTPADSFAFPPLSLTAPRVGRTIVARFPPPDSAPPRPAPTIVLAPLQVTRRGPEGEIHTGAEQIVVAFSEPMVPLASVGDVAGRAVPARITPQPPGRWRWLDVRTLRFEPEGRLPMATEFTVEVPAGTRSAAGRPLDEEVRWTFRTAAPRATGSWPHGGPTRREPVLLVAFDQRVDPGAVLRTIRLRDGRRDVPVRLATAQEVEADSAVRALVRGLPAGRWVAFRPVRPVRVEAELLATVGPGTPSAEGPRFTESIQEWGFWTYRPLRLLGRGCGWSGRCRPGMPFIYRFNNALVPPVDPASLVRVEPAIAGMRVEVAGNHLRIFGETEANTTYTVRLDATMRDVFGQVWRRPRTDRFVVGEPYPGLWGTGETMVVLDPAAPPRVPVYSHDHRRLRVRLYQVAPEDWWTYLSPPQRRQGEPRPPPPGREVHSRVLTLETSPGEVTETFIDLAPALREGVGQVLLVVEAMDGPDGAREQVVRLWVQATRIGLTAFSDQEQLMGWASSLVDGFPLADVRLGLAPWGGEAATGADGLATLPLPPRDSVAAMLVARRGADVAFLPRRTGRIGWVDWARRTTPDVLAWYTFTDRNLYRPGEEVHFKGWVRRMVRSAGGGVRLATDLPSSAAYRVRDPQGNEIASGTVRLSPLGGFDGAFRLPEGATLGSARVELELPGGSQSIYFQVQEFRRPEYQVAASASPGPHFVGGAADVTARATYFSGGGLPGAAVRWQVTSSPAYYAPPGWDRWSFGGDAGDGRNRLTTTSHAFASTTDATGAHHLRLDFLHADPPRTYSVSATATVEDVNRQTWTSATQLLVHPAAVFVGLRTQRGWIEGGQPLDVDVAVVDVSGRPVPGQAVELRAERMEWQRTAEGWREVATDAQPCTVTSGAQAGSCAFRTTAGGLYRVIATTTDAEGRPAVSVLSRWVSGAPAHGPDMAQSKTVEIVPDRESYQPGDTAALLLRLPFAPARGVVTLRRGNLERTLPVEADGPTVAVHVPIGEEDIPDLVVGVNVVGGGETAGGPSAPGTDFAAGRVELRVPPLARRLGVDVAPRDSALTPGASTAVDLVVRDAAGRPVAGAEVALVVVDEAVLALTGYTLPDPLESFYPARGDRVGEVHLRSAVMLALAEGFEPGPGRITGVVVTGSGRPQGGAPVRLEGRGEVTYTDGDGRFRFGGLPEGTYTVRIDAPGWTAVSRTVILGPQGAPPLRVLLTEEGTEDVQEERRGFRLPRIRLRDDPPPAAPAPPPPPPAAPPPPAPPAPAGEAVAGAPIALRSDFNPLAVFAPEARTDAQGRVRVEFRVPDNLTRYRVTAVAVHGGERYGMGESAITARQPLMVRPSPPRFLNFGDRFELPVVIQNQTDRPLRVDVAARSTGVALAEPGRRVTVPAGDRVEVRFPAEAVRAGPAAFQVAVASGGVADAAQFTLPVWTPATAEAFATYGNFAEGAVTLPLEVPADAIPAFGGLEVTTSSTALQELTDALLYLVRYRYECAEQLSSRVMAIAALRDVLTAFRAEEMPSPEELRAFVERDLAALAAMQNGDGGFGFWKRGDPSWPYVSIHAAHALHRAREKGYAVPERTYRNALGYLRDVRGRIPRDYPADARRALEAYAVYVRAQMGDGRIDGEVRRQLEGGVDQLPLEVAGWLLAAASADSGLEAERDALLRHVTSRATDTPSTATFVTRYTEGEYLLLHSDRRTDGVVLEALLRADPRNELVVKTVRGLLGHRVGGRWSNTQENAWVLLALDRYFSAYEGETPEFVARVWLGERYAGGHTFSGRTADRHLVSIPMRVLAEDDPESVTVGKEGPGRLYYRAGLRYAPRALDLAPLQQGFAVERTYEAVDDAADVVRGEDGVWRMRAGARVRVTVTMTAPSRRVHVALVDPLPAGLEAVNAGLLGTEGTPSGGRPLMPSGPYDWYWRTWWYDHQNLRDDRAEAFASYLPAGVYTYSYVARATTPGEFIVPPARAEEMYTPETFGRGQTDRVVVEVPQAR